MSFYAWVPRGQTHWYWYSFALRPDKFHFVPLDAALSRSMTTSCTTRPLVSPALLQFRRRGAVEHLTLGTFEQIERVGFDRERTPLALEFRDPLDPRKRLGQIRAAGKR